MYLSKTRYPISFNIRRIIQLRLHQFLRYVTFDTIRPGIYLRNFLISKTWNSPFLHHKPQNENNKLITAPLMHGNLDQITVFY